MKYVHFNPIINYIIVLLLLNEVIINDYWDEYNNLSCDNISILYYLHLISFPFSHKNLGSKHNFYNNTSCKTNILGQKSH